MADDAPNIGDFLIGLRDQIASGESLYGKPDSPKAVEKLAEINARLEFGRQQGEIQPAAPAWSPERVAQERLASEFPLGNPSGTMHEMLREHVGRQFEALGKLKPVDVETAADKVAEDLVNRTSMVSLRHGMFKDGRRPSGHTILEGLAADASIGIADILPADKVAEMTKLVRADRPLLEHFAARGQAIAAYRAAKAKYGVK